MQGQLCDIRMNAKSSISYTGNGVLASAEQRVGGRKRPEKQENHDKVLITVHQSVLQNMVSG